MKALLEADARWLRRIHSLAGGRADAPMRSLTWLGNHYTWWLHTAAVAFFFGWLSAALLGGGSGAAALVAQAIKRSVRRRRPDVGLLEFQASSANPDKFSFPSGHSSGAFGAAVAVAFVAPMLGLVYGLLAVGIAFSRLYLGAHYPLDVAVGVLVGIFSGWISAEVILWVWPTLLTLLELPAGLA
jgi:undecaprenyl-diphosphatase